MREESSTPPAYAVPARAGTLWLKVAPGAAALLVLYALLAALSLFILMPIGWMLTAALKPDTAPIFTFPPEWYPTQYWHWQTFTEALLNPRPALHPLCRQQHDSGHLQRDRRRALELVDRLSLRPPAFPRQEPAFQRRDRHDVAAWACPAHPPVPDLFPARLVWHLSAPDCALLYGRRLLCLPAAPVHALHSPRSGRGGAHRRRQLLADLSGASSCPSPCPR